MALSFATTAATRPSVERGVMIAAMIALVALVVFVLFPTAKVLAYPPLADYLQMFKRTRWLTAAGNSVVITVLSTLSATIIGFVFAFVTTRRDMPARRFFNLMGTLPLFAPPFMVAFAYILMFGRQGLVTREMLGLNINIFGWHGLWLAQTVAFFPLSMTIIRGVLQGIHPSSEQASLTLGATELKALRTVTLPLAMPGIIGAMLVVAITVLADFGNAVVIAGNYPLLATEAWFRMEGLADLNGAAVVVAVLLIPTIALFLASRYLTSRGSFTTVTGRGSDMDQIATPLGVKIACVVLCSIVSLLVVSLYVGILLAGLVNSWGRDWSLTFKHWGEVMNYWPSLQTSLLASLLAAAVTAVLGQILAFLNSRSIPFRKTLDFLAVLPGALPGVFVGVGFVLAFNAPPIQLGGSIWIIVLALGFWHLPLAYQSTVSAIGQIHKSIEDAARDLGASELRLVRDVYVPLLSRSLIASFLQAFIRSVSNISVVVFLVAPGNVVVTFIILQMIGGANWTGAASLTTFLLFITFVCVGLGHLVAARNAPRLRGV